MDNDYSWVLYSLLVTLGLYYCFSFRRSFDLTKKHVALYGHDMDLLEQLTYECYFAGARVTLLYSSLDSKTKVSKLLKSLERHSAQGARIKCSEYDPAKSAQSLKEAEHKSHGAFDVLIVCSGLQDSAEFTETTTASIREAVETNYLQPVEILRHVGRVMESRGAGRICVVESAPAFLCMPGMCSPAAGALAAYTAIMRCELPHVKVLFFGLSLLNSQQQGFPTLGNPVSVQEAANSVLDALRAGKSVSMHNNWHSLLSIAAEGASVRFSLVSDAFLSCGSVLFGLFYYWRVSLPWTYRLRSS